jgi:phage terminase large subunit-like protein
VPQRTITAPGHDRGRSLGWIGVWWIESFVRHGRGDAIGDQIRYGDEFTAFIADCYALAPVTGRRLYDSAFFSRPKGCDKSGIAAAIALFEAFGPARFAGWAKGGETYTFLGKTYTYQRGEPMGKAVKNPLIKVMATEEGQTGNVYDNIYFNLTDSDAPLYALRAYGIQAHKLRILDGDRPIIVPSTAGAASKDGGLETFAVFDETHLYNKPELREMFKVVSRNLRKRKRNTGTWYLETTTMYAPGEESIAEETYADALLILEGRKRRPKLLFDHRWADVAELERIREGENKETEEEYLARLAAAFTEAYGDAMAWNDVEALIDGLFDTHQTESETRRYFFNALVAATNAWVQFAEWNRIGLKERRAAAAQAGRRFRFVPPKKGDTITLGFDGGQTDDATVLIACRVSDRYVWPVFIIEVPDGPESKNWRVDEHEVDALVRATFEKFNVVAFFADPPYWQDYIEKWERDFGDRLKVKASGSSAIKFFTKLDTLMSGALERSHTAIVGQHVWHGNHLALTRHVMNARRWRRAGGVVIGKDKKGSPLKMDAAVGMALALEGAARYEAKNGGAKKPYVPFKARGTTPTKPPVNEAGTGPKKTVARAMVVPKRPPGGS